ncbi:hypothetical protein DOTSEDRAFT_31679 [Dothistroma septosporum NZE10]|uniref:Uncharacterized protein n=1 Tax=Dothistroma septosporum (strain NZE10 / CBS 128990) TaxID=675120 RepID=N1PUQ2_DOTSN|nr:hypothetical protein DOTSEDRAFT_31679 [Dothistroma septosporum NZE10]
MATAPFVKDAGVKHDGHWLGTLNARHPYIDPLPLLPAPDRRLPYSLQHVSRLHATRPCNLHCTHCRIRTAPNPSYEVPRFGVIDSRFRNLQGGCVRNTWNQALFDSRFSRNCCVRVRTMSPADGYTGSMWTILEVEPWELVIDAVSSETLLPQGDTVRF